MIVLDGSRTESEIAAVVNEAQPITDSLGAVKESLQRIASQALLLTSTNV